MKKHLAQPFAWFLVVLHQEGLQVPCSKFPRPAWLFPSDNCSTMVYIGLCCSRRKHDMASTMGTMKILQYLWLKESIPLRAALFSQASALAVTPMCWLGEVAWNNWTFQILSSVLPALAFECGWVTYSYSPTGNCLNSSFGGKVTFDITVLFSLVRELPGTSSVVHIAIHVQGCPVIFSM